MPADTVSDERADDRKAGVLGRLLNGRRELSHALAVSQLLDAAIERLFGDAHQSPRLLAHLSDACRYRVRRKSGRPKSRRPRPSFEWPTRAFPCARRLSTARCRDRAPLR